ncbi:hypothetical protein C9993_04165 [Marinobacter sp. Z-F4-2]|nr:hypothetical protein C9993_04165 [Marinobacter sp. Z-F4-2]
MVNVGITEAHGIAKEQIRYPPEGVAYKKVESEGSFSDHLIYSSAKGVLDFYHCPEMDLLEAPLFPIRTNMPWIYTPADTASAMAFSFGPIPNPRFIRELYLKKIFQRKNFIKLLFKSQAGLKTLEEYPILSSSEIRKKVDVLYPAVRHVPIEFLNRDPSIVRIVFAGEFFRKGGQHVVDAFLHLASFRQDINLTICASREFDFRGPKKEEYLKKIDEHPRIDLAYYEREQLFKDVYRRSHIFVSPTYGESFGYAILEAMAHALPIVSTNHFAIPEIVENNHSGFLIDTDEIGVSHLLGDYKISNIPVNIERSMTGSVIKMLKVLIENPDLRSSMGMNGHKIANSKFSFSRRNDYLGKLYHEVE